MKLKRSKTNHFKQLEVLANSLECNPADAKEVFAKLDAQSKPYEPVKFARVADLVQSSLVAGGAQCTAYRFSRDEKFGGYTYEVSGLKQSAADDGVLYCHIARKNDKYVAFASFKYHSPYRIPEKAWFSLDKKMESIWKQFASMGFEKVKRSESNVDDFISNVDTYANFTCVDLKPGASLEIANKIRARLRKQFKVTKVISTDSNYTVIGKQSKTGQTPAKSVE